jgi:prevent-host-death family protein
MDKVVTVHAAKTQLSRLLAEVEAGETVIIARGRTPIAKLVPLAPAGQRKFGAMKGQVALTPTFFEPLTDEELAGWGQ